MCSFDAAAFEAASWESRAVAELHLLNAAWVRAFADSDAAWYGEHLHDGFACTLADGQRIDKREFLRRARRRRVAGVGCDEVDVRVLDDFALVHGVKHHRSGRTLSLTRYITVWQSRCARGWRAIAAQFTPIRDPCSADIDCSCIARWFRLR